MIRFLPEWHPQAGILLTWPYNKNDWGDSLDSIQNLYLNMISKLSQTENVIVLCESAETEIRIRHRLAVPEHFPEATPANIRILLIPTDDIWIRDYGPLSVQHSQQTERHCFQFNAWGNKYTHALDSQVNNQLEKLPGMDARSWHFHSLVLEGGAVETNGRHFLIANRDCVLNPNRNLYSQSEFENHLTRYLGIQQVLWLDSLTLAGDDTDGHIDNFVRFSSAQTIAYMHTDKQSDPHFSVLKSLEKQLQQYCKSSRQVYELVPIPLPEPVYGINNQRLPASYLNFLISNNIVLLPQFGVNEDSTAISLLARLFPERKVIGLPCSVLLNQGGGIHCATMQLAL